MKTIPIFLILSLFVHLKVNSQVISEADLMTFMSMTTSEMITGNQVLQIGNQNHAEIGGTNLSVNQQGANQHFYYQESTLTPSTIQVEMTGDANYVEIMGNNSIMENMAIKVNGNYRSVIIRNYQ